MEFERLEIPEVVLVRPRVFADDRGFFCERYKASAFRRAGIDDTFVQDNHSYSRRGTLRGLHYQKAPHAQAKLVGVTRGEILDVAVDIRRGSPSYGRWVAARLSAENHHLLYVPVGFAHGFVVLSDEADVTYKVTAEYAPEADRGILWSDPELGIDWGTATPLVSSKDANQPLLRDADNDFRYRASS